jgi:hypothetical protein
MAQTFYLGSYNNATATTELDAEVPGYQALTIINELGTGLVCQAIGSGTQQLAGVMGQAYGTGAGFSAGVIGVGELVPGVVGLSNSGYAMVAVSGDPGNQNTGSLMAFSQNGGIYTQSYTGSALQAYNSGTTNNAALTATSSNWAAWFQGGVWISGELFVEGSSSTVIDHPDGSQRRLCSIATPEAWFEDFGRASLQGGVATVALEARFAVLVDSEDYHVFLTAEGECNGLYVASRSRDAFVVRESNDGSSDVAFSYRIASRRSDTDNERFKAVMPPGQPDLPAAENVTVLAEDLLHQAESVRVRRKSPES